MNRQPSLHDPAEGSAPLPQRFNFVTVEDADAKAMRSFWRGLVIGAFTLAMGLLANAALASPQCDTIDRVTSLLTDKYGETVRSTGFGGRRRGDQPLGFRQDRNLDHHPDAGRWADVPHVVRDQLCRCSGG